MKKLFLYVFLILMFCNVGFAECIEGDCDNGYGTWTFADGDKYVGEFKEGAMHGRGTFITTDGSTYAGEFKDGKIDGLKEQPEKKLMKMEMKIAPTGFDFICCHTLGLVAIEMVPFADAKSKQMNCKGTCCFVITTAYDVDTNDNAIVKIDTVSGNTCTR